MPTPTTQPKTQNQPAAGAKPAPGPTKNVGANNPQLRALTEKLAYEMWEKKGRKHGHDVENWVEAERIARKQLGI